MPEDRPIHVRVAEALGWQDMFREDERLHGYAPDDRWTGKLPVHQDLGNRVQVWRYDLDWSATGPEIEKHKISLTQEAVFKTGEQQLWCATNWRISGWANGPTPLLAVCELLIKLGEAGKL